MTALVGPLSMICGVLAVAGVAKIMSPLPSRQALAGIGLRVPTAVVRALGIVEFIVAGATIVIGGIVLPLIVGAIHVGFAVVVSFLLGRPGGASCGCFGSLDTPVSVLHLGANIVSAAVAFAAVGAPGIVDVIADQPGGAAAYLLLVVAGTACGLAVLTLLPRLRPGPATAPAFALRGGR